MSCYIWRRCRRQLDAQHGSLCSTPLSGASLNVSSVLIFFASLGRHPLTASLIECQPVVNSSFYFYFINVLPFLLFVFYATFTVNNYPLTCFIYLHLIFKNKRKYILQSVLGELLPTLKYKNKSLNHHLVAQMLHCDYLT